VTDFVSSCDFGSTSFVSYIGNTVSKGKYSFHKSIFDPEKYLKEKSNADSNGKKLDFIPRSDVTFSISVIDETKVREESLKELNVVLNLLTLHTNQIFRGGAISYRKINPDGTLSHSTVTLTSTIIRNSSPEELSFDLLTRVINLKEKIDSLDEKERILILRALEWYKRGTSEGDKINAYANYWIGFESLSFLFGDGPPRLCTNCGEQVDEHSISKRMQEFLLKLGFNDRWKSEVKNLYRIRNLLFHNSSTEFHKENVDKLRNVLNDCIIECLKYIGFKEKGIK